jgi:hypothetical protein
MVVPHPTVLLTSFFLWRYRGIHSFCFGGVEVLCIHVVLNRSILMHLLKVLSDTGFWEMHISYLHYLITNMITLWTMILGLAVSNSICREKFPESILFTKSRTSCHVCLCLRYQKMDVCVFKSNRFYNGNKFITWFPYILTWDKGCCCQKYTFRYTDRYIMMLHKEQEH